MSLLQNIFTKNHHQTAWKVILLFLIAAVDVIPGRSTAYNQKDADTSSETLPISHFKGTENIGSHFMKQNETSIQR